MKNLDDPAFPVPPNSSVRGLTKREVMEIVFTAAALNGMTANPAVLAIKDGHIGPEAFVEAARGYATLTIILMSQGK